jgi:hypothetical protein
MLEFIIKKIKKLKRKIYFQDKNTSLNHHNLINYDRNLNEHDFKLEKNKHVLILNSFLSKYNFILKNELKSDNIKEYLIFDIGAGSLIHTNYFCNFAKKVYSIEPSLNAIKIGKKIYGDLKNNIIINDFAEDALEKLPLSGKSFFHTGHVLSHLTDKSTKQILEIINNNSSIGSYLLFDELWSNKIEVKNKLFFIRNKKFWKSNLSNFDINFYEFKNNISGISFYKGFFGKKVKQ